MFGRNKPIPTPDPVDEVVELGDEELEDVAGGWSDPNPDPEPPPDPNGATGGSGA